MGAVQHYFRTRDEMMTFALSVVRARNEARVTEAVRRLGDPPSPRALLRTLLVELLPLDEPRRADGRVATRNYIGLLTSVNCSATVARYISDAFRRNPFTGEDPLADFPHVDGVVALTHKTGCGMASEGDGVDIIRRTIAGYARHPNFASVMMIGLGCETFQYGPLVEEAGLEEGKTFRTMMIQNQGGTRKTIEAACAMIDDMLPDVGRIRRTPQPLSGIKLALECGYTAARSGGR